MALGEIAHIVADSPNGPRGDSPLTAAARNDYQNLILLCNQHHRVGNFGAMFSLGRLLDHLGRSDEALAWYMQASPQHPQAAQAFKTRWFAALNPRSLPHEIGIPPSAEHGQGAH
ncbi:hypothetical protein [Nocardia mikamii]|uniref:hypothetical protein n=1 Tax=Nocardia mikamii TaxID=508464 RepID=UPI0007A46DF9|nr:hypothetical protein [Nocardia mikamii]